MLRRYRKRRERQRSSRRAQADRATKPATEPAPLCNERNRQISVGVQRIDEPCFPFPAERRDQ